MTYRSAADEFDERMDALGMATVFETIRFRRIEFHLAAALEAAEEQFHDDYAADYIIGRVQQWSAVKFPRTDTPANKKKRIPGTIRIAVFERDEYRCLRCGTWKDLTLDHIVPESQGGESTVENLQTLCRSCNCKKGTKAA